VWGREAEEERGGGRVSRGAPCSRTKGEARCACEQVKGGNWCAAGAWDAARATDRLGIRGMDPHVRC
jgi:hypothetical protein